ALFADRRRSFSVAARAGDATTTLAAKISAAINAKTDLPVTAAIDSGNHAKVNLTAKWEGGSGNYIVIERSFWGQANPIAAYVSITAISGGTGSMDSSASLGQFNKRKFDVFCGPTRGGVSTSTITTFMDGVSGRWSPLQQQYGHYFTSLNAAFAGAITTGLAMNDPHQTIIAHNNSPSPE